METHIVDFEGDLYGRVVTVELLRHLRDECRFSSVEELRAQVLRDVERAKEVCAAQKGAL